MKTPETNDWMIMNTLIYKIYTTEDSEEMRRQLLEQLKMLIDFDGAVFSLASSNEKEALSDTILFNCEEDEAIPYELADYGNAVQSGGKCTVYRETDLIAEEKRVECTYYKKIYRPNNWHYSMQMVIGKNKRFLGILTLYRTIGKMNFQYNDIVLLDMLKEHLAYRLEKDREERAYYEDRYSIEQAVITFGLTRREQLILSLLVKGIENKDICDQLSISVNTLKKHILNIYRKLGIRNRVQMFGMISDRAC